MAVEKRKLSAMNIIDTGFGKPKPATIAFLPGTILPNPSYGFTYRFRYRRKSDGSEVIGCGVVANERYGGMSPSEIELTCALENPMTKEDRMKFAEENDMTEAPE